MNHFAEAFSFCEETVRPNTLIGLSDVTQEGLG